MGMAFIIKHMVKSNFWIALKQFEKTFIFQYNYSDQNDLDKAIGY
jgi:hypothetical protein